MPEPRTVPMLPDAAQQALVRSSFMQAEALGEGLAAAFYGRLFERDPTLPALFGRDLRAQHARLLEMLAFCVHHLDVPQRLHTRLAELGHRHAGYGVKPQDYRLVAGTLVDTLAAALGSGFTPAHRKAWATTVDAIVQGMQV